MSFAYSSITIATIVEPDNFSSDPYDWSSPIMDLIPTPPSRTDASPRRRKYSKRAIGSCTECYRRKQKCDRQLPCNNCVSRRSSPQCVYESSVQPRAQHRASTRINTTTETEIIQSDSDVPGSIDSAGFRTRNTEESGESDTQILESLGYMKNAPDTLSTDLEKVVAQKPSNEMRPHESHKAMIDLVKIFPKRMIIDFLIHVFIQEVNWIYEMIHPPTFLERYYSWWSQSSHNTTDDIQFGLLILRICLNSIQALPHAKHSTDGLIDVSLEHLENDLSLNASKLEAYHPRVASITRVQHLFFHICYLKNSGKIKDSWFALGEAVKEAHELGLHLEDACAKLNNFKKQIYGRTFWSLFIWDRFMSAFLGRWPLIPENRCDVRLPQDSLNAITSNPYTLTPFTDRIVHVKVTQLMTIIMASPSWKLERANPEAVLRYAKRFQDEIIDTLPPAFKLTNPDTSWDVALPSLPRKREHLTATIYGILAAIHRGFIDPYSYRDFTIAQREIAETHQMTLANGCCDTISSVIRLHQVMGGTARRAFFIPMMLIEASAVLGMCLLSTRPRRLEASRYMESRQAMYKSFLDAMSQLLVLAGGSHIATKGVNILRGLKTKVESHLVLHPSPYILHLNSDTLGESATPRVLDQSKERVEDTNRLILDPPTDPFSSVREVDDMEWNGLMISSDMDPDLAALVSAHDQSWFFNDGLFTLDMEEESQT